MLRRGVETLGLALGMAIVPLLPRRLVVWLAAVLGGVGYRLSRRDRMLALWNLKTAFGPAMDLRRRNEVALESFRGFSLLVLDLFWFSRDTVRRVRKYVIKDTSFGRVSAANPCIIVTAHFGNWEMLGLFTALECGGLLSVVSPLANPLADRVLNRVRARTGQTLAARRGAVRAMLSRLREGGSVALLPDQNTVPRDGGVFVDFFGLPAPVSRMPAALQARTGAVILPTFCSVEPRGFYRIWTAEPLAASGGDHGETVCTQRMMQAIEGAIRENPGSWLWMYRRWKLVPPGADKSRFPPYSRDLRECEAAAGGRKTEADR